MNLTYKVTQSGYTILDDGTPWIVQENYIPYPGDTMEESAQNHINKIIEERTKAQEEADKPTLEDRVKALEEVQLTAMGV